MPTVTVVSGNERDKNPPLLPTPRRATLESARKKYSLSEQEDDRCIKNMIFAWHQTLL